MSPPIDLLDRLGHVVHSRRASLAAMARAEGLPAEDAVDCLQEAVCTVLCKQASAPDDDEQLASLLATMVRNAARNRRRRHHLARPHLDVAEHAIEADQPDAHELVARAEERLRLRACVAELCETQRAVVTLRMLEEQPGDDVARALGITPSHVAVLLHRAKASLRTCMTSERPARA